MSPPSRGDIERWVAAGLARRATHLIVACDTFDHACYPVYVAPGEDARARVEQLAARSLQRVEEVYWLAGTPAELAAQLDAHRAFVYGPEDLGRKGDRS